MDKNDLTIIRNSEEFKTGLSYILSDIFCAGSITEHTISDVNDLMDANVNARFLKLLKNANLDQPEAAAEEAAKEFCCEWLENAGYKITLEAKDVNDDNDLPAAQG